MIKFSLGCLIYKSVDWLKFIYNQVHKYTSMNDKEFYFVANDANEEVLNYLKNSNIKYYIWNNSDEQRKDWYINNVYRAWNYVAEKAKGEYIVFISSDMGFSNFWFNNLLEHKKDDNFVTSRLVESGKMLSGKYGISKNFGRTLSEYDEEGFLNYASSISENKLMEGGLYGSLLINKLDFMRIGGYPEGNIVPDSDIFNPIIAKLGESCVPGDQVLIKKLNSVGIKHQTAFDSIVYHFQLGEMDG